MNTGSSAISWLCLAEPAPEPLTVMAGRQTSLADDRYSLSQREQRLDPERFPLMTAAGRLAFPDPGARFERNVRRLVAAFEHW
ncbi:hypothetical protein [Microlunatus ginsengisoli]|uniref:Uncharacterized protein n=1 Tax=Microlunatus ginsengisoli TaxID=363863 RepID=A0ABP7AMF0_9ACTN